MKPVAVRAVEYLLRALRALSVAIAVVAALGALFGGECALWPLLLCLAALPLLLIPGMLKSVQSGRFEWFILPSLAIAAAVVWAFHVHLCVVRHTGGGADAGSVAASAAVVLFAVVPSALLLLPSSLKWAAKTKSVRRKDKAGCMTGVGLVSLLLLVAMVLPSCSGFPELALYKEIRAAEQMQERLQENDALRASGSEWVDPSACADSIQFVRKLLGDKANGSMFADSWCIAVNPPDDDAFPVVVTREIDIAGMLNLENARRPIGIAQPSGDSKYRRCRLWTKPMVVLRNGQVKIVQSLTEDDGSTGCRTPEEVFGGRVPCPGPDTYFLTPTGRVKP